MNAKYKSEIGVGLAAIFIAALGWFVVIPVGIDLPSQIDIGALAPDFWPRIVMVMLGACGLVIAGQGYLDGRHQTGGDEPEDLDEAEVIEHSPAQMAARVTFALGAMFLFYFAIVEIGIVVASTIIMIVFTYALGQRQWKYILALAVGLPVILYFFFVHVASVPMPLGVFEVLR